MKDLNLESIKKDLENTLKEIVSITDRRVEEFLRSRLGKEFNEYYVKAMDDLTLDKATELLDKLSAKYRAITDSLDNEFEKYKKTAEKCKNEIQNERDKFERYYKTEILEKLGNIFEVQNGLLKTFLQSLVEQNKEYLKELEERANRAQKDMDIRFSTLETQIKGVNEVLERISSLESEVEHLKTRVEQNEHKMDELLALMKEIKSALEKPKKFLWFERSASK